MNARELADEFGQLDVALDDLTAAVLDHKDTVLNYVAHVRARVALLNNELRKHEVA